MPEVMQSGTVEENDIPVFLILLTDSGGRGKDFSRRRSDYYYRA
jgi:hypothetical protein